jgi:DNA-directed RNA polymerase specialized sigma24 family protein
MDFAKLANHDPTEWRQIYPRVYGIAHSVGLKTCSLLTGGDLIDIAEETYILAMQQVGEIDSDKFWGWISGAAYNKAMARMRSKGGVRSVEGQSDSLDERLERVGGEADPALAVMPVTTMEQEERRLLFRELFSLVDVEDQQLIHDYWVLNLKGRELAQKYGWGENGEKSASARCEQARRRALKIFASDPRAAKLVSDLQSGSPLL